MYSNVSLVGAETRNGYAPMLSQEEERHHSSASDAFMNGSYGPEIIL
jgi:hypothetical protein